MSGRTFFLFLFDAPGKVTEPLTNRKEKRMETQTEPEVLDALRNKLATVRKERSREKLFRLVRILDEEGSYGALMELLPELTVFPAAYLSAGRTKIRHGGRITIKQVKITAGIKHRKTTRMRNRINFHRIARFSGRKVLRED